MNKYMDGCEAENLSCCGGCHHTCHCYEERPNHKREQRERRRAARHFRRFERESE